MCIRKMWLSQDLWSIPHCRMLFCAVLASLSNPCKKIPCRPRDGNKKVTAAWLKSSKNQDSLVFCQEFILAFAKQRFGHGRGDALWEEVMAPVPCMVCMLGLYQWCLCQITISGKFPATNSGVWLNQSTRFGSHWISANPCTQSCPFLLPQGLAAFSLSQLTPGAAPPLVHPGSVWLCQGS